MKQITGILTCVAILCCGLLSGCSGTDGYEDNDLMREIEAQETDKEAVPVSEESAVAAADFAVRLFQESYDADRNILISPVSVLCAMAMTANGAQGDTLAQMEEVLGMPVSEWNGYLKAYTDTLAEDSESTLNIANSIWFKDEGYTVEQEFLQTNADYYDADLYELPFDDEALNKINSWVEDNTDGKIREILDRISSDAWMYLINAVSFDAEWDVIYKEDEIRDGTFTSEDGQIQEAEMMCSEEQMYLEDGSATGFMKYYAGSKYAFVALLPNEGISLEEYMASLTGERLSSLLAHPQLTNVSAEIPKFESEYDTDLAVFLSGMGMRNAFDMDHADFTGIIRDDVLFIGRVMHKTYIAVDEKGTQAGAASAVEMLEKTALIDDMERKEVILDRPFVYMVIDCEANLPLFIGTIKSLE